MRQEKTFRDSGKKRIFKRKGENHRVRTALIFNKVTFNKGEQQLQSSNLVNVSLKLNFTNLVGFRVFEILEDNPYLAISICLKEWNTFSIIQNFL